MASHNLVDDDFSFPFESISHRFSTCICVYCVYCNFPSQLLSPLCDEICQNRRSNAWDCQIEQRYFTFSDRGWVSIIQIILELYQIIYSSYPIWWKIVSKLHSINVQLQFKPTNSPTDRYHISMPLKKMYRLAQSVLIYTGLGNTIPILGVQRVQNCGELIKS